MHQFHYQDHIQCVGRCLWSINYCFRSCDWTFASIIIRPLSLPHIRTGRQNAAPSYY